MSELPKLTEKENSCLTRYLTNGFKKSEAYRYAYNCENMSENAISVEASRFFNNNPKITLWLDEYRKNQQKSVQEELNYTAVDAMKEYADLQEKSMDSPKTFSVAKGCIDSKCKLAGLFENEKDNSSGSTVTIMGNISLNNENLDFKVGEEVASTSQNT